jgi:hypothetical protein
MARHEVDRQAEDPTLAAQCRTRRQVVAVIEAPRRTAEDTVVRLPVADRTEAIPEVVRTAVLLVADTPPPDVTIITDRFSPRFTPHLTHRQEASEGASCPPRRAALGKQVRQDVMRRTVRLSDLRVEWI